MMKKRLKYVEEKKEKPTNQSSLPSLFPLPPLELSSTLMEKMQGQEMLSGLRLPELEDLGQFFRSLPTSTLVGIGALTAVLAYWLSTRPRAVQPPCDLRHQSQEVPVGLSVAVLGPL